MIFPRDTGTVPGRDEYVARTGEMRVLLGECAQKFYALHEQKGRILGQVDYLEHHKPQISEYNKKKVQMGGLDRSLSLKNQLTNINEQIVLLQDQKKGYSADFGKLISERDNVMDVLKGYLDQRDELNPKIQAMTAAERPMLRLEASVSGSFQCSGLGQKDWLEGDASGLVV